MNMFMKYEDKDKLQKFQLDRISRNCEFYL